MGKTYLRFEASDCFGLISSPGCVDLVSATVSGIQVVLSGALEHVQMWNAAQGVLLATFTPERLIATGAGSTFSDKHLPAVTRLAVSPDQKTLAVGYADGSLRLWQLESRKCLLTMHGHKSAVTALNYSKDGSRLFLLFL